MNSLAKTRKGRDRMNDKNMLEAEMEAKRFLKKVEAYKESDCYNENNDGYAYFYSPDRAAVKRSSMDLTKALSKMRNK